MKLFSLRSIIDDILLIVRNNNISESEDLSRAQIALWILSYKSMILKRKLDENKASGDEEDYDDEFSKTIGPLKLTDQQSLSGAPLYTKYTEQQITDLLDNNEDNIIAVYDEEFCPLQQMSRVRRHFHFARKYTKDELTYNYNDDRIYVTGKSDCNRLRYIWVSYLSSGEDKESDEDIVIPGWMIPEIKDNILKRELAFMVQMPSDDDNNSTLDGIKPQGKAELEK